MGKIMIITDSGCDIPKNMLMDNIRVIPLTVNLGGKEFLTEDKINKKCFTCDLNVGFRNFGINLDKNSILEVLNSIGEEYDEIIFITSSGMIYPNHEIIIKDTVLEYFANHILSRISIIDSNTISMALGFLVLDAANMAKNGLGFEDLVNYINNNKSKYRLDFVTDDINCLREQQIIHSRKAKLANKKSYLFSMSRFGYFRPILGRESSSKVKGVMLDRLIDNVSEYYAIVSTFLNNDANNFSEYLSEYTELYPVQSEFSCSNISLIGTNSIGLCYKKK